MPMWVVSGHPALGAAIEQLEKDSDRAVGVVAAAIVEQRLSELILLHLHKTDQKILERIFRVGGPVGSFSAKIDMAFLMGLVSLAFHAEMVIVKNIRNAFAHKLESTTFDTQKVRDLCFKLNYVEQWVGDISPEEEEAMRGGKFDFKTPEGSPPIRFTGAGEALKNARRRYILSAQILSWNMERASHIGLKNPAF